MSATPDHSRWLSPPPIYDTPSTSLKPYLELNHLLSLTWLAYPILSLIFVAFRLQLSSDSAQTAIANAKGDLLTSCKAAEQAATAAASMPRFMAIATNNQFADAVNGSMDAARAALVLALTVMEAIINFIVDIYRSTFLCFLELVVRGGLAILIGAVQEISNVVQTTANGIRTSIQNDVSSANSAIQSAVDAVNKVNPFGKVNAPQITVPSLDALQNVTIPTDFENALTTLNNSLPSLQDLKDKVNQVLDTPFELVKQEINQTFAGLSFDPSLLPVPPQNDLTFCDQMDTSVVDDLGHDLLKAAKIGIALIVVAALLLLAGNCLLEWYKWRCLKRHLQHTREAWTSDPTLHHTAPNQLMPNVTLTDHNLLMLRANSEHPLLTRFAHNLARRLHLSASQHIHLRWFLHYVFHPPALACFLIGFFGLLSVQLQLFAISPLEAKYSHRASTSVADFSNTIATSVNSNMLNQSATYANEVNGRVDTIQAQINDGLFGWVNSTTTVLNNTVNAFYDDVQNAVSAVFNGTILDSPMQEFVRCFIGSKVDAIEDALTFLHNNLNVDLPRVNQSILLLSPQEVDEATQPIAAAAIGGGNNDNEGLVGRLVNTYVASLKKERVMFGIFMGLWAIVVFMALCIIFWHSYGRNLLEAHRKRKWQRRQKTGINGIVVPFRDRFDSQTSRTEKDSQLSEENERPRRGFGFFTRSTSAKDPADSTDDGSHDSFRKRGPSEESVVSRSISAPRKLMALGRKAAGRERFVGDAEKSDNFADSGLARRPTWFGRVKGLLVHQEEEPTPTRPALQVVVNSPASPKPPPAPVFDPTARDWVPPSAWSVSPGERPVSKPWSGYTGSTKKPSTVHHAPTASLNDGSTYINPSPPIRKLPSKPTPLAIPVPRDQWAKPLSRHSPSPPPSRSPVYQTQYAQPLRPTRLAPAPQVHHRSSSVPSLTPVTRLLTTTPARKSSLVDPFATPFDDEYSAVPLPTRPNNG